MLKECGGRLRTKKSNPPPFMMEVPFLLCCVLYFFFYIYNLYNNFSFARDSLLVLYPAVSGSVRFCFLLPNQNAMTIHFTVCSSIKTVQDLQPIMLI